jgi:hypothetical protein
MGLKDKLKAAVGSVWSPITVWMADEGSDKLVTAGGQAKVVVAVKGADDGTAERVEVELVLTGQGMSAPQKWPLGEVPAVVGLQETVVTIPTGVPPACATYAEYAFKATLHRSKGMGSDAQSIVDVIARPEDVYWPDGPRSGFDGDKTASLDITVDSDVVAAGTDVTGRVTTTDGTTVSVTVGALVTSPTSPKGKFKEVGSVEVAPGAPFSIPVPEAVPPTLSNGQSEIVWQVRAKVGGTTAWRLFGVVDPTGASGIRNRPSPTLIGWLASLDTPGPN